jgi:hypothetical protein
MTRAHAPRQVAMIRDSRERREDIYLTLVNHK